MPGSKNVSRTRKIASVLAVWRLGSTRMPTKTVRSTGRSPSSFLAACLQLMSAGNSKKRSS